MRTPICETLGIEFPLFAFSHCRDVVAAVTNAGGFGVLGALTFTPEQLDEELTWIDAHTGGRPYGVDIVIPAKYVGREAGDMSNVDLKKMIPPEVSKFLNDLLAKHEVPELPEGFGGFSEMLGWSAGGGRAHLEVAMKHPIRLLVNALGPPPEDVIELAHAQGILVGALVGTPEQARKQKQVGVDIIIASGTEAGGHTGEVASMVLTPQCVDAVAPTPVLTAGGVGTGRQLAAALCLGAQGAWTGLHLAHHQRVRRGRVAHREAAGRHVERHAALALPDRKARASAEDHVHHGVGGRRRARPAAHAAAVHGRGRREQPHLEALADQPPHRGRSHGHRRGPDRGDDEQAPPGARGGHVHRDRVRRGAGSAGGAAGAVERVRVRWHERDS
jgi:NAD(P)H-dependent flavin oxidoreductase YrpB (nitropropane dioxygenase family)